MEPSAKEVLDRAIRQTSKRRPDLGPIMVPSEREWPTILRALRVLAVVETMTPQELQLEAECNVTSRGLRDFLRSLASALNQESGT